MSLSKKDDSLPKVIYSFVWGVLSITFIFFIMVFFPLYYRDKYYDIAYYKWTLYVFVVLIFLILLLFLSVFERLIKIKKAKYIFVDFVVIAYGVVVVICYITCPNKMAAFMGTDGWYMGMVAQLLFVFTYLAFSRRRSHEKICMFLICMGSISCFVIGILQRYGLDFLHLYWEMPPEVIRDYLSTIGNRTWFSAYACTVFPVGVYMFWKAQTKEKLLVYGIYTCITFACLVTINSDSAYAGVGVVLYILLLLSFGNSERIKKYILILIMWFGACCVMALWRIPNKNLVRDLRGLSRLFLNIYFVFPMFLLFILLYFWLNKYKAKINETDKYKWRRIVLQATVIIIVACIGLIIINTYGLLQKWFGITLNNQYFYFDESWGDYRGSSWMFALKMFSELPLKQKLFGVGADCFAYHAYGNSEYSRYLESIWGEAILANAHNEWLNSFVCFGVVGGILYISIFINALITCLKKVEDNSVSSIVPAIGLCIAGYMAHNFFCYQQVSATGVIFVLMGIAMCQAKESIKSN